MAPSSNAKRVVVKPDDLALAGRIRQRAYELYVQRGNESGSDVEDWLQAEDEIRHLEEQKIGDR